MRNYFKLSILSETNNRNMNNMNICMIGHDNTFCEKLAMQCVTRSSILLGLSY